MKKTRVLAVALASLLLLSLSSPAFAEDDNEYDDDDAAFLVVRKSFADESPAGIGKPAAVVVEIYNSGESAARNIQVDDTAALPEGLKLADGAVATAVFRSLEAGATVKFQYDVLPTAGGKAIQLPRAKVTYTVTDSGKESTRTAASSAAVVYIETSAEKAFRTALVTGSYATLGLIKTPEQWRSLALIAGFVGFVFGGSSVWGKGKEAAAASRRSKALAALESDKTK